MKFTAEKPALKNAIAAASGSVESRNTIPVLGNVLIEVIDGFGYFTGTNLDQQVRALFPVDGDENGVITAPAAKIKEIVNAAPDGALISFDLSDETLGVKYGRSRFKVQTLPASDFPSFANMTPEVTVTVPADKLRDALKYVEFSQSTEETRYYLQGVFFECEGDGVRLTSTDGHKLSNAFIESGCSDEKFSGILPRRAVGEVLRLLPSSGEVTFTAGKVFAFDLGDVQLSSKAIDGAFPDYRRVIPQSSQHSAIIDTKRLYQAVRRAMISSDDRATSVKLSIADGEFTVSARGPLTEAADMFEIDADFNIEIGINAKYLIEALARYDGDVQMKLNDPASPTLWEDERGMTVIMPLRI